MQHLCLTIGVQFNYVGSVLIIVIVHNASAIFIGYMAARLLRVVEADRRAIAIETGIQNSGLGLVLVFKLFRRSWWYGNISSYLGNLAYYIRSHRSHLFGLAKHQVSLVSNLLQK